MKIKNKFLSALVLSLAVTGVAIPGVAHAGAGTWDPLDGFDEGWVDGTMRTFSSQILYSGGGNFKAEIEINETYGFLYAELWESDNGTTTGGTKLGSTTCNVNDPCVFAVGETDGDNNKAEVYLKLKTSGPSYGAVRVKYYD